MKTEIEQARETISQLRMQLFEANSIIEAIKEGAIDALVVSNEGRSSIYSLESADFTYRMLIEKSGEGALSISSTGLIVYCNECFAQMAGRTADKIIGTYFNSYVDSVGKFQQLKTQLQTGPSKGEITLNVDGRRVPVYASLTDLRPQVEAIGIIITDLTEKRKQEDALGEYRRRLEARISELKRINFNLEQYIYVITHDIREPLRKILELSNALVQNNQKLFDHEEVRKLRVVSTAAARLNTMVSDVSRYTLNIHHSDSSEVDLNTVLKEVTDDLSMVIEERKVRLTMKELPRIKGSRLQMHLLFLNLLDTAIRCTKDGTQPEIRISAEVDDCVDIHRPNKKYYRIKLHDSRSTIRGNADSLFTTALGVERGGENYELGIGLSICKKIMENHAGRFELENTMRDGNIFKLYFPLPSEKN